MDDLEREDEVDVVYATTREGRVPHPIPRVCCEVAAEHQARGVDMPPMVHEGTCPVVLADQPFMSLREALVSDDATWVGFINQPHIWDDPDSRTGRRIRWEPREQSYEEMGGHLWRADRGPYSFCHRPGCRLVHLRWDWSSACPDVSVDASAIDQEGGVRVDQKNPGTPIAEASYPTPDGVVIRWVNSDRAEILAGNPDGPGRGLIAEVTADELGTSGLLTVVHIVNMLGLAYTFAVDVEGVPPDFVEQGRV